MPPPPTPNALATRFGLLSQEEYPSNKTDRATYILATPNDMDHLSEKQCYVRTRLCEVFLSTQTDVEKMVRGRRAAFVGQVGLRCVFCVPALESKDRVDRALCYPTKIAKFYQTVQDMQHFHFNSCPAIPLHVKERYQQTKGNMNNRRNDDNKISPKEYWAKCCEEIGLVDHIADDGTNAGVRLKEGHSLVERSKLPEYAKELFMPPKEKEDGGEDEGGGEGKVEVELLLENEEGADGDGGGEIGFTLSDEGGDQGKGDNGMDDEEDGTGDMEEQDEGESEDLDNVAIELDGQDVAADNGDEQDGGEAEEEGGE